MVVAVIGTIIPPMVILTIISFFYVAFATNTYIALILKDAGRCCCSDT